jgi:bacterioferritin (cytochrome b1)
MDETTVIDGLLALKKDYLMCQCHTNVIVIDEAIRILKEQEERIKKLEESLKLPLMN